MNDTTESVGPDLSRTRDLLSGIRSDIQAVQDAKAGLNCALDCLRAGLDDRFLDELELVTWCGGLGSRWAERRVSISSPSGASVEAAPPSSASSSSKPAAASSLRLPLRPKPRNTSTTRDVIPLRCDSGG